MLEQATSIVPTQAFFCWWKQESLSMRDQKELNTPTPKCSGAFKDNCVIFFFLDESQKKAVFLWRDCAGHVWVQPCPSRAMAVSEADETMQQSSLSHQPAEAPWWFGTASFVSDLKSFNVPKMWSQPTIGTSRGSRLWLSWWSSKDDKARICFVSSPPPFIALEPQGQLDHPTTKAWVFWAEPGLDPVGEGLVTEGPPTGAEPVFLFSRRQCQDSSGNKCSTNGSESMRRHFHT